MRKFKTLWRLLQKRYKKQAILGAAVLVFLLLLVINILTADKDKLATEINPENLSAEENLPVSEINKVAPDADLPADLKLPDLQVLPLDESRIEKDRNKKLMRFPGSFANTGDGPLELSAVFDKTSKTTIASQVIFKADGSKIERRIGAFILHPTHSHWHFENFVEFELFSLKNKNELDEPLVSTGKLTYCIHDYAPIPQKFPGQPDQAEYPWCTSAIANQGISIGWYDKYASDIPGQELDITGLPDGNYAFRAIADPDNRIAEKDESNNITVDYLNISADEVRLISKSEL